MVQLWKTLLVPSDAHHKTESQLPTNMTYSWVLTLLLPYKPFIVLCVLQEIAYWSVNSCVNFHFSGFFPCSFFSSNHFSIFLSFCFCFVLGESKLKQSKYCLDCYEQINIIKLFLRKLKCICIFTKGLLFSLLKIQLKPSQSSWVLCDKDNFWRSNRNRALFEGTHVINKSSGWNFNEMLRMP